MKLNRKLAHLLHVQCKCTWIFSMSDEVCGREGEENSMAHPDASQNAYYWNTSLHTDKWNLVRFTGFFLRWISQHPNNDVDNRQNHSFI